VLVDAPGAEMVRDALAADTDHAAPHLIDAEVIGVIRAHHLRGLIDATTASQAVDDLRGWPGERYRHRTLLARAWELRHSVRIWDALYVALAEVLQAELITLDERLASADGPRCPIRVVAARKGHD
jgi:predicted nucleic acid-binding protein